MKEFLTLDLHVHKMFYRQKINELCYMYNLLLNFSIYVHVSDIQLSKNECVAFAEIGWTLQGLNTLLLIFFSCLSEFASGLPGPPHRIFLRSPPHRHQCQLQQSKYRGDPQSSQSREDRQLLRATIHNTFPFPAHSCVLNYYRRISFIGSFVIIFCSRLYKP